MPSSQAQDDHRQADEQEGHDGGFGDALNHFTRTAT
jgi:hypothetical protein